MSRKRHGRAIVIGSHSMPPGTQFHRHTHETHQLAWASSGTLTVAADTRTWVLPSTRALWVPAGLPHGVTSASHSTMMSLYLSTAPETTSSWTGPQPIAVSPLLAEVIRYLGDPALGTDRRARGEALVLDLLEPVAVTTLDTPPPTDPRARKVAQALLDDPSCQYSLDAWGRRVGASGRTLARLFLSDTGMPFGRWRTLVRLQAALPALAAGEPLSRVSQAVGYETVSAFVAAFRRETGVTPGTYFQVPRPPSR